MTGHRATFRQVGSAQEPAELIVRLLPSLMFLLGMCFVALPQSDFFRAIPGDLGDARFNSLILEHVFRWLCGIEESLWSPGFFYPFPGSLSFSDTHFGTIAIYAALRWIGLTPETAYAGWFTAAFVANYAACYYVARQFGLSATGSAVAAFLFTFAMPAIAQSGHAQLGYRFAVPLAALALHRLMNGGAGELARLAVWVTVQFYCSIYIGYFLLLMLVSYALAVHLMHIGSTQPWPYRALLDFVRRRDAGLWRSVLLLVLCVVALAILFLPYAHYAKLYGFARSAAEIHVMLPRIGSYFIADGSTWWGNPSSFIDGIPARHEHQLFVGVAAGLLALIGVLGTASAALRAMALSFVFLLVLTLSFRGVSVYFLLESLPMANAIRAVSRVILVMVFPLALLAGAGAERLMSWRRKRALGGMLAAVLIVGLIAESATIVQYKVSIADWRSYLGNLVAKAPREFPSDAIIFVPSEPGVPRYMTELDGMNLAQHLDLKTINGYSGNAPLGFGLTEDPCEDLVDRLAGYAQLMKVDHQQMTELASRVVVIGRTLECTIPEVLPVRVRHSGPLELRRFGEVSLQFGEIKVLEDKRLSVVVTLNNSSEEPLPSVSDSGHVIRFSWRFVPIGTQLPLSAGWEPRMDLRADVPAHGMRNQTMVIVGPAAAGLYRLEFSLVQEGIRWFHDAGMPIAASKQIIEATDGGLVLLTRP